MELTLLEIEVLLLAIARAGQSAETLGPHMVSARAKLNKRRKELIEGTDWHCSPEGNWFYGLQRDYLPTGEWIKHCPTCGYIYGSQSTMPPSDWTQSHYNGNCEKYLNKSERLNDDTKELSRKRSLFQE